MRPAGAGRCNPEPRWPVPDDSQDELNPAGSGGIHSAGEEGSVASHPARNTQPFLVAPTPADTPTPLNTLALDLVAVACLSLHDVLFEFDASFVTPSVRELISRLPGLRRAHRRKSTGALPPISVFGHADPVGSDDYNKSLSGRRARAVYALLTRNVGMWEDLYAHPIPPNGDNWRDKKVMQKMRDTVGPAADGKSDREVFGLYMAAICPFQLEKSDFLGGGTASGKADYQGCSDFNPLVLLAKPEEAKMTKLQRNAENQPNRRVVIYLFRPDYPPIDASSWPCPRAEEGAAGCHVRFFADAARRRTQGDTRRTFAESTDTFACRFYDRIAHDSPCERILPARPGFIWLRLCILDDSGNPRPQLPYSISIDGAPIESVAPLQTDSQGMLEHEIPVNSTTGNLSFDDTEMSLQLTLPPVATTIGLQARLKNLGYFVGPLDGKIGPITQNAIAGFQRDNGLPVSGMPDDRTRQQVVKRHGF
jgi:hypothetical protein